MSRVDTLQIAGLACTQLLSNGKTSEEARDGTFLIHLL